MEGTCLCSGVLPCAKRSQTSMDAPLVLLLVHLIARDNLSGYLSGYMSAKAVAYRRTLHWPTPTGPES
jgi:hypothetical protein